MVNMSETDLKNAAREIKDMCQQHKNCYGCTFCKERQCVLTQSFPDKWEIDREEKTK